MLTSYLLKLQKQYPLDKSDVDAMLEAMLDENTPVEQVAGAIALLHLGNIDTTLFSNIAEKLRSISKGLKLNVPVLDIVGTGGDAGNTINISTGSALLLAACGVDVAKHGSNAVSSLCGAADVLDALGIHVEQTRHEVQKNIEHHHFAFLYGPLYNPALMCLRTTRKRLGLPSVFNLMGPLLNPVGAEYLLIGVYDESLLKLYAETLAKLSVKKAMVFHTEGMDELTTTGTAKAFVIHNGEIESLTLNPEDYGFTLGQQKDLRGGKPKINADKLLSAFSGETSVISDTLAFNAGVGLYVAEHVESIQAGVDEAKAVLASGEVLTLVEKLRKKTYV